MYTRHQISPAATVTHPRLWAELGRDLVRELAHIRLAPPLACVLEGGTGTEHFEEGSDAGLIAWREIDEERGCDEEAVA